MSEVKMTTHNIRAGVNYPERGADREIEAYILLAGLAYLSSAADEYIIPDNMKDYFMVKIPMMQKEPAHIDINIAKVEGSSGPIIGFHGVYIDLDTGYIPMLKRKQSDYFPLFNFRGFVEDELGIPFDKGVWAKFLEEFKLGIMSLEEFFEAVTDPQKFSNFKSKTAAVYQIITGDLSFSMPDRQDVIRGLMEALYYCVAQLAVFNAQDSQFYTAGASKEGPKFVRIAEEFEALHDISPLLPDFINSLRDFSLYSRALCEHNAELSTNQEGPYDIHGFNPYGGWSFNKEDAMLDDVHPERAEDKVRELSSMAGVEGLISKHLVRPGGNYTSPQYREPSKSAAVALNTYDFAQSVGRDLEMDAGFMSLEENENLDELKNVTEAIGARDVLSGARLRTLSTGLKREETRETLRDNQRQMARVEDMAHYAKAGGYLDDFEKQAMVLSRMLERIESCMQ